MDQFYWLTCVLLFADVTLKTSLVSIEGRHIDYSKKWKKHFTFDLAHVINNVDGISVKIDGLVDLGPKWNFEYTLIPYSDKSISSNGHETTSEAENEATTTPTPAEQMGTERISTKKKSRNKIRPAKHSGKSGKSSAKKAGKDIKKNFTKIQHDFIYKNVDNKSLILRNPHKVQEDSRLRDFTVHVYKQALRVFEDLKKKFNDTKFNKKINELIHSYRDKFAEFVNETQFVTVKTRLGTQKVILNTLESSNMILKKLIDHLTADTIHKGVLRNERKDVAGLLKAQLEKEVDVEYKHVCSKFGVCRSGYVFSNFLADVVGDIIRGDDNKLRIATDAITEVVKARYFKNILEDKVEKRFRQDIDLAEEMNTDQIRAFLQIFRGILVNKNKPLPVMGAMDSRVMNKSLAMLDLIDLFDEKIQPNEENKLLWNDLQASSRDWADGNRDDITEIMDALVRHVMKSGLEKFDSKTTKALNHKLKIFYDIKR